MAFLLMWLFLLKWLFCWCDFFLLKWLFCWCGLFSRNGLFSKPGAEDSAEWTCTWPRRCRGCWPWCRSEPPTPAWSSAGTRSSCATLTGALPTWRLTIKKLTLLHTCNNSYNICKIETSFYKKNYNYRIITYQRGEA